jgi:hypothetical protein
MSTEIAHSFRSAARGCSEGHSSTQYADYEFFKILREEDKDVARIAYRHAGHVGGNRLLCVGDLYAYSDSHLRISADDLE